MKIIIEQDPELGFYSVTVDGEVFLECVGESELDLITLKDLKECSEND
jgi:hypothetical protein